MDSLTPFDDDDFFGSYDPEKAGGVSLASLEFDAAEAPPTAEQLAHWTRFRRPVAGVVAAMALLSIVALEKHGSQQHGSERELIAHYSAALAAPTLSATTAASAKQTAAVSETSSNLVPEALSALVLEAWSVLVPDASSAANTAPPALVMSAIDPELEPVPLDTAPTELFIRPQTHLVTEFISAPTPMCMLPAGTAVTLDSERDAAGSPPLLDTNRSISTHRSPRPSRR